MSFKIHSTRNAILRWGGTAVKQVDTIISLHGDLIFIGKLKAEQVITR